MRMNDSTTSYSHGDNSHKDTNPELTGWKDKHGRVVCKSWL